MRRPKVLVVGINPWVDNTGINTLINFFDFWGADEVALIYTREGLPNTSMCNHFFQISERRLIKGYTNTSIQTGQVVKNTPQTFNQNAEAKNRSIYKKLGSFGPVLRELIWKFGRWNDKNLHDFLDDFKPDVLFIPTYGNAYMNRLQNCVADYTGKPVILYASDDNYSYKSISKSPLSIFLRYIVRQQQRKLFKRASKVMVIAPKTKQEYDELFGSDCVIMTKGVDFESYPFKDKFIGDPIIISYTGKLIYGRWKSLEALSQAVRNLNNRGLKIQFDIYTTDILTDKIKTALSNEGTCIKGAIPHTEVNDVLDNSDIVVFAESLEPRYKNLARLSLSTKITDYLRSGKCIFAIGDKDIAPIDYLTRNDAAIVSTSNDDIEGALFKLISQPELIHSYGRKAYECGKKNHSKELQRRTLEDTINSVL